MKFKPMSSQTVRRRLSFREWLSNVATAVRTTHTEQEFVKVKRTDDEDAPYTIGVTMMRGWKPQWRKDAYKPKDTKCSK